jgi:HEAT repeat protein
MKAVEPEPEPEVVEEVPAEPEPEPESLLGDLGEVVMPVKKEQPATLALQADHALLSEESLYSDDDPLDKLKPQKKGVASGSSATAAKVSGRIPAVPAKISNRGMPSVPSKISNRAMPAVDKKAPEPEPAAEEVEAVEEAAAEPVAEAPKSNKKILPAKGSARGIAPASKRGLTPAKAEEPAVEEEAPVEEAAAEAPAEELEIQEEAPAPAEKKGVSSRISRRDSRTVRGSSVRKTVAKEPEPEPEEEPSSRSGRRRSMRSSKPKGFTKLQKILAGVAVLLVVVCVVGYGPFMYWMMVSKGFLAEGASVDERKRAAEKIFEYYKDSGGVALNVFSGNANSADKTIKEASIYGLELCGKVPVNRPEVITEFGSGLTKADTEGKKLYIHALGNIAKSAAKMPEGSGKQAEEQIKKDNDDLRHISEILLPLTDVARESDLDTRSAAVEATAALRVPGVCQQMIKIAASSDTGLLAKARDAIIPTALPEAAADLLDAMGKPDTDLQKTARAAFAQICDQAPSEIISRAVGNEVPDVRKEVVKALSVRKSDIAAALGLLRAIKDKLPEIRAAAVAGLPTTGMTGSARQLAPLMTDENEAVRVATADTLGKLKDDESQKMVIEAFKNEMQGATQQAFVKALGLRCPNKATHLQESLKAIKIVMDVLEANPNSAQNVIEALALLTAANGGGARINERRGWSLDKWKKWYANITEREQIRSDVMIKLEELRKKKDDDHGTFGRLFKETDTQLERLQKCIDMCAPNDPEDAPPMNGDMQHFMILKEHFGKNAFLNEK